ncbi:MAG: winged helix-turn-helix domain-containing protein, partial [Myxococcota bacterium]
MSPSVRYFALAGCKVDLVRAEVYTATGIAPLTPVEVRLLAYLADRPGVVVSHAEILRDLWGAVTADSAAVGVAVRRLRRKVGHDALETVRGIGYRLDLRARVPDGVGQTWPLLARLPASGVLTVVGPPGAGKTRLARQLVAAWPGGARFVSLDRTRPIPELCGADLWVFDDADAAIHELRTRAIAPLRSQRIVLTSTVEPGFGEVHHVPLLAADEAAEMFAEAARRSGAAVDGAACGSLIQALGGLPSAIALIAARTSTLRPSELLERIEHLRSGGLGPLDAAMTISWSLLPSHHQDALRWFSGLPTGFTIEEAEGVVDSRARDPVPHLLDRLGRLAFVEVVRDGDPAVPPTFGVPSSVRQFVSSPDPAHGRSRSSRERSGQGRSAGLDPGAEQPGDQLRV